MSAYPVIGGKLGRTDQGVDFSGVGATVRAIGPGRVRSVGRWNGWPGSGGIVYETGGRNIFVMEDFLPAAGLRPGDSLKAGQTIGRIGQGSSGIEMGYANAAGTTPLVRYNGLPDGTPTSGGKAFAKLLGNLKGKPQHGGGGLLGGAVGVLGDIGKATQIPVDAAASALGIGGADKALADSTSAAGDLATSAAKATAKVIWDLFVSTLGDSAAKVALYALLVVGGLALAVTGIKRVASAHGATA